MTAKKVDTKVAVGTVETRVTVETLETGADSGVLKNPFFIT